PEFRFLDRITSLIAGKSGTAEFILKGTEDFLSGHFPDDPLMPGVLMVEAVAQLAGAIAQSDPNYPLLPDLKLTAIRGAKITGTARPLQTILYSVQIAARMGKLIQARGSATVDGKLVLETEVTLAGAAVP
ncbi:MAG: hydroxymyristoyl-ACP dehydratase, partial [Verrucomicrobiales bacterium]|nr:hydroxymyristoyl-ACP dehydratase [Verrucomicrobiales bacterium]